jgi:hypothetical protein
VFIAGQQVPILLYADDMVMLARSQAELGQMNAIVTAFAHKNRFEFNGSKSGVMAFNASKREKAKCDAHPWKLFGEAVEVKSAYTYLGTITPTDGMSWTAQVDLAIKKAKRRSADLLWICRGDRGIRSRTAVTLWQALVRPLLEYASELWEGCATVAQVKKAELVQMTFLRSTLGLHANGSGVADAVLRAEAGCERLADRRTKLKLGYWRKLFSAKPGRLLGKVATFRWRERVRAQEVDPHARDAFGSRGFMPTAEAAFDRADLRTFWQSPTTAGRQSSATWKLTVDKAVDTSSNTEREQHMLALPSVAPYLGLKDWGLNPKAYAFSKGEEDKIGQHVPERYLDDRSDLKGTRLKLLCRTSALPVMNRIGREAGWPKALRTCLACTTGEVEDVEHFVLGCPHYATERTRLLADTRRALTRTLGPIGTGEFDALPRRGKLAILLGRRIDDPAIEDRIDRTCKTYLKKAWNARSTFTTIINNQLGTTYDVFKHVR